MEFNLDIIHDLYISTTSAALAYIPNIISAKTGII
jgi:hypothetical protein